MDPNKACHFCGNPAHGACCWPVDAFRVESVSNLKVGDQVRRFKDVEPPRNGRVAQVHKIERGKSLVRVHVFVQNPRSSYSRFDDFTVQSQFEMRVRRVGPCGLFACDLHLAARGPGVYVRRDHWDGWARGAA